MVLVLIVFSTLSLLAFGLCHRVRLEIKMARMRGDDLRAYYLALGGLNRAVAALRQGQDGMQDVVHFGQVWHLNATARQEGFWEDRDDSWHDACCLSYATSDEQGRLNINTSSPAGWMNLPGMNRSILHAIVDWQDADDTPGPSGAESAEYLRRVPKYRAKNEPMAMVWELALVRHVDWLTLVGEDCASHRPPGADGGAAHGLVDFFTVCGDGRVNLNTASEPVLSALPGIEPRVAREIVALRAGADAEPFTGDDRFFASFDDLARIPGLTRGQWDLLREYGRFASRHFRVVSKASVRKDGRPCRLTGTVRRDDAGIRLVLLRRG